MKIHSNKICTKTVGCEETILQTFFIYHVEQFSITTFCGSSWKTWRESPSSWRCPVVSRTKNLFYYLNLTKLHGVWGSKPSEQLRWFETDVIGFENEVCQRWWLRNPKYQRKKRAKNRQKRKRKWRLRRSKSLQFLSFLLWMTFCTQCFPFLKFTSTVSNFSTLKDCMCTSFYFQQIQGGYLWIQKGFALLGVRLWWISAWNIWSALVWTFFHQEKEITQWTRWLRVVW